MEFVFGCENEATAYVVDDYPYGFRLRTKIRYWVDTTKHGQRFCSQTLNPKTGNWNKPKKGIYIDIGFMTIDDKGHIGWTGFGAAYTNQDELDKFLEKVGTENLSEYQRNKVKWMRAIYKTREHIKVEIRPSGFLTPEEQDARDKEQEETKRGIGKCFAYYARQEGYQPEGGAK